MDAEYEKILEFDDQSPSFAYGFQAGQIWALMGTGQPFDFLFSGDILELVQRMPARKGYVFEFTTLGDNWYSINATPG